MQRFVDDDGGYLDWLEHHPDGFVLNTYPHVTSEYLILHRAACRTINRPLERGRQWTHLYGKSCSDSRQELEVWAFDSTGRVVKPCGLCLGGDAFSLSLTGREGGQGGGGRRPRALSEPMVFDGEPITVRVSAAPGQDAPPVVIEGAQWLAETFFRRDPSAQGQGSYDAWIRDTQADPTRRSRVLDEDVTAINRPWRPARRIATGPLLWQPRPGRGWRRSTPAGISWN